MDLEGRVALVTGGGSGIGAATARRLAAEGMELCILDVNEHAAADVAGPLGGLGLACDVAVPEQLDAAFRQCTDELGSPDLVVLNAGITFHWSGDIGALDVADYRRSVGVNVDGVVFGARAAVNAMRASGVETERAIIVTASLAGLMPYHPDPVYALGKHAVVGLVRSVAANLAPEQIAVHAVCPGITATGALGDRRSMVENIGVPVMEPEVVADAVVVAATAPIATAGSCWVVQHDTPLWVMNFAELSGPDDLLNAPIARRS